MTDILIFISYTASYNIILTNLLGEDKQMYILKSRLVLVKGKLNYYAYLTVFVALRLEVLRLRSTSSLNVCLSPS